MQCQVGEDCTFIWALESNAWLFMLFFFKSVLKKVGLKLNKLLIYCVTAWRSRPTFKQSGDACKGLHADHSYHKNTDSSDHEKPQQRASNHVYVLFSSSPFRIHHKTLHLTMKETFALTSARWWIQEFKTTTQWDARYECNMKTRTWNNPGCLSYVGNLRRHCFFISTSCWRMGGESSAIVIFLQLIVIFLQLVLKLVSLVATDA